MLGFCETLVKLFERRMALSPIVGHQVAVLIQFRNIRIRRVQLTKNVVFGPA